MKRRDAFRSQMKQPRPSMSLSLMVADQPALSAVAALFIADYELTDDDIVRRFILLAPDDARVEGPARNCISRAQAFADSSYQRLALARWPNGVECLLCFARDQLNPRPEQLIRAYKNAFAARCLAIGVQQNNGSES